MTQPTALVVEDDRGLLSVYRHVLKELGYAILEAVDGPTALHLLEEHTPNIMYLDIRLPLLSGIDVLEFVKTQQRLHHLHVVVVTSSKNVEQITRDSEHVSFILKPIHPEEIREHALNVIA